MTMSELVTFILILLWATIMLLILWERDENQEKGKEE